MYKEFTDKPSYYTIKDKRNLLRVQRILTDYLKEAEVWNPKRDMTKEGHSFAHNSAFYDEMVRKGLLEKLYKLHYQRVSLSKTFMKEIGFKTTRDDGQYGEAKDIRTNGMTVIQWNREGRSCTYFGEQLEPNIGVTIFKDAGSRTVFNGYIFGEFQLKDILKMTW